MRVRFRKPAPSTLSPREAAFIAPQQTFLSPEKCYVVHAVSVYNQVVFIQVLDDLDTPVFLPRALFDTVDVGIPDDWICNVFPEGAVQLLMGPPYVAKDVDAYDAMVDQNVAMVEQFWRRVGSDGAPEE